MNNPLLLQLQTQLTQQGSVTFTVKIIPKSAHNEVVGMLGSDILKVKIAAVPENNRANEELCRFLAKVFAVTMQEVTIVSGKTSQRKVIRISMINR